MQIIMALLLALAASLVSAQPQSTSPACVSTTSSSIICSSAPTSSTPSPCVSPSTSSKMHTTKVTSKTPCTSAKRTTRPITAPSPTDGNKQSCEQLYSDCRTKPDANQAFCASQYAACLGYNPFTNNGTGTATSNYGNNVYTTKVVTKYTTYCPSPTTVTYQNMTFTVTAPTTLTITNCPCTITSLVNSLVAATTKPPTRSATQSIRAPTSLAPIYSSKSGPSLQPDIPVSMPPANMPTNIPTQTTAAPTSMKPMVTYTGSAAKPQVDHALLLAAVGWLALQ